MLGDISAIDEENLIALTEARDAQIGRHVRSDTRNDNRHQLISASLEVQCITTSAMNRYQVTAILISCEATDEK